jgi:hypothetical protein
MTFQVDERKLLELAERLRAAKKETPDAIQAEIDRLEAEAAAGKAADARTIEELEQNLLDLHKEDARVRKAIRAGWLALLPALVAGHEHSQAVALARQRLARLKEGYALPPVATTEEGALQMPSARLLQMRDLGPALRLWVEKLYGDPPKR